MINFFSRYFNLFANSMDENGLSEEFPYGSRQLSAREKSKRQKRVYITSKLEPSGVKHNFRSNP